MEPVKQYDHHLGNFYAWLTDDFDTQQEEQKVIFESHGISPKGNRKAIDLGAGLGLQSVSLAHLGFEVKAIDLSEVLMDQLRVNTKDLPVEVINDDMLHVKKHAGEAPELIVCCGDTITYLRRLSHIESFINDTCDALASGGKLILSFRDYSKELKGNDRFLLLKGGNNRTLTSFLEYDGDFVTVTDILCEYTDGQWQQNISSYKKIRVSARQIARFLTANGMQIAHNETVDKFATIIAVKP